MQISETYTDIGYSLLHIHPELEAIGTYGVQIAFLSSNKAKKSRGRVIFADCTKVSDRYKWTCPFDFIITVYEPNCAEYGFSDEQIKTLLWHEMRHIGREDGKKGPRYYVKPHDIEEFEKIINSKGINWQKENYGQEREADEDAADREDKQREDNI